MATIVAFSFPLGRYHATRWDGGANTSEVEWPPSPWRILRALIAVSYSRWPELPSSELDDLLAALGTPTAFHTPDVLPGTTRHYMPDVRHSRAQIGNTDQVIDAFLALGSREKLKVYWDHDITAEQRATLAKLVEMMPYLGRSESICVGELLDAEESPDETWWRLGESRECAERTELLAPVGTPRREHLEATTLSTRKARRLIPVGARRVTYSRLAAHSTAGPEPGLAARGSVNALRFELSAPVGVRARNVILATDAMHGLIGRALKGSEFDSARGELVGKGGDGAMRRSGHDHLHLLPVKASRGQMLASDGIEALVVWRKAPLGSDLAGWLVANARRLVVRDDLAQGMVPQRLLFAGAGPLTGLAPGLCGPSRVWSSTMPYLPVRHRKAGQSDEQFWLEDVAFECRYRGLDEPTSVTRLGDSSLAGQVAQFRRRRPRERIDKQRRGVYLRVEFAHAIDGPLVIGQLSHFGFGLFEAYDGA